MNPPRFDSQLSWEREKNEMYFLLVRRKEKRKSPDEGFVLRGHSLRSPERGMKLIASNESLRKPISHLCGKVGIPLFGRARRHKHFEEYFSHLAPNPGKFCDRRKAKPRFARLMFLVPFRN